MNQRTVTRVASCNITNVLFTDCAVIFRDAVWDNDFVSALAICRECGQGKVSNVVFQNIEIYYDKGHPINCIVNNTEIKNTSFDGIVFRNITANAKMKGQFKDRGTGNTMDVVIDNVVINGLKIKRWNFGLGFLSYEGCQPEFY